METALHLEPGGALKCPVCGGLDTLQGLDGDTVQTAGAIPNRKIVANGLAVSSAGHCYHATIVLCVCGTCQARPYYIQLDVVNCPEISYDWADKYFCVNEEITEPVAVFTVTPRSGPGIPESWLLERIETDVGTLDRHFFGPFVGGEDLAGPNGVASCEGGTQWKDAAGLLARVWPLITGSCDAPH
jgi:hypothetical protein